MSDAQQKHRPKGEILKEAREAQGLSLLSVHEATKIPLDVLKAIEEGYTVRTLSPFYLKGFVKMYAQHLGVDIHQVIDNYHREKLPKKIEEEKERVSVSFDIQRFWTKNIQQQFFKGAAVLLALFLVFRVVGCIKNNRQQRAQKGDTEVSGTAPSSEEDASQAGQQEEGKEQPKTSAPAPTVPPKKEKTPPEPVASVKEVRLTVKAKKSGWLQVKVDGNLVFQSILNSGATETWEAEQSIELSGKNIHSLEYEVNGKVLGELGRTDRSARRVVITKDGFTVKQ